MGDPGGWGDRGLAVRRGAAVRGALAAAVVLLLTAGGAASRRQVAVWHDDETLWQAVLASGPSALAENNLGAMALGAGRVHEAVDRSLRSLEIAPGYNRPWANLRRILESPGGEITPGETSGIVEILGRSLRHQEGSATAHYIHALALERSGTAPGARRALLRALKIRPTMSSRNGRSSGSDPASAPRAELRGENRVSGRRPSRP